MLKGNKGISLTLAVITVLALIIILSTISFSAVNSIKMRRLNKLYNDIRVLNDAVAVYYIKNNELPIENSSTYEIELGSEVDEKLKFILKPSSANFTTSADLLNPNDFGSFKKTVTSGSSTTENTVEGVKYYKLNTGLLKNLSLNYDKVRNIYYKSRKLYDILCRRY